MGNVINPKFTSQLMNLAATPKLGFAGYISDTSLLNVDTAFNDGTVSGSKFTRAGTVFVISGVTANKNLKGDTGIVAADVLTAQAAGQTVGAVAFSQSGARHPEVDGIARNDYAPETPINVVSVGTIWMLLKATTGVVYGKGVAVAAARTTPGQEVTGWVEAVAFDAATAIKGWKFTGRTETDDDGQLIAEVIINRQ